MINQLRGGIIYCIPPHFEKVIQQKLLIKFLNYNSGTRKKNSHYLEIKFLEYSGADLTLKKHNNLPLTGLCNNMNLSKILKFMENILRNNANEMAR